jgi:hypothetical protein
MKKKNNEKTIAAVEMICKTYADSLDDKSGILHNNLVAVIADSKLPIAHALLVVKMLEKELIDQAFSRYLGA